MSGYQKTVCRKAVERYGKQSQLTMAMEEMSELTQALSKNLRGIDNVDNIAEEIADVEIMLMQLKQIFHCGKKVNDWKLSKIARLEMRLMDEVEE